MDGFKSVFMGSTYEFDLSRQPGKPGKNLKKIFESKLRDGLI